jgi:hypothetical protein
MAKSKLDATGLIMPKATAVWLVENTALTFEQIAGFTGLHHIEVQALADEDVGRGIVGRNPLDHGELIQGELDKATKDSSYIMKMAKRKDLPSVKVRSKGPKYTPVSKRGDKPDAISYLIKHHPEITDAQICKLIGTTKPTVNAVRERTHANIANIKPKHPVDLGLCTYAELEAASKKGLKAQGKTDEEIQAHKDKIMGNQENQEEAPAQNPGNSFDFSNFMDMANAAPAQESSSDQEDEKSDSSLGGL